MEKIPVIKFFKHKYGDELLIDLNDIGYIKSGIARHPVHRYSFYCIMLVTDGEEKLGINDETVVARRGTIIATIPGDVWRWQQDTSLQGYVLVFEEEFLLSFFNDRSFLHKFPFLQSGRKTPFYIIDDTLYERLCPIMEQIKTEIHGSASNQRTTSLPDIDQHILRAMLYQALALLKRSDAVITELRNIADTSLKRYIEPFTELVERHFTTQRNIGFYADRLCITPGYLNKLTKQLLGINVKGYVNNRIVQEIKNLLDYTSLSVAEIADQLNFQSSSYLVRYFKSQTGTTPLDYRKREY